MNQWPQYIVAKTIIEKIYCHWKKMVSVNRKYKYVYGVLP